MRRAARVDANQAEIIDAMRKCGASVAVIREPVDLAVGIGGISVLVEVKDGKKPPSAQKYTEQQAEFFSTWRGSKARVDSVESAIRLIDILKATSKRMGSYD